jgi:hypothetical protein
MFKFLKFCIATVSAVALTLFSTYSYAADSVRIPGQGGSGQCPTGYQASTGVEVNATTGETFTICFAPPSAEEVATQQQDQDFQSRIAAAQAAAEVESRNWNAANPGMQKCVQWGPVVHANGVTSSSGGVCANPVSANDSNVPEISAGVIRGDEPISTSGPKQSSGEPMYVEIPGQSAIENCPAGYQGGNALNLDVSTGKTTTQCWTKDAFDAWRLGGDIWQSYVSTGGAVDVQAEVERRNKVASLKSKALEIANDAAAKTPGVKRCSYWDGYGETGKECAYAFINPSDKASSEEVTSGVSRLEDSAPVLAATKVTNAASIKISAPKGSTVTLKTLTPTVCKTQGTKAISKKAGTCRISISTKSAKGKISRSTKSVVFVK